MSSQPPRKKVDPWEARERERARWNRTGRPRSARAEAPDVFSADDFDLRENFPVIGLLLSVTLLILAGVATFSDPTRYLLMQVGTFLILLTLGGTRAFQDPVLPALARGPNPFILLLVTWAGYAFWIAPFRETGFAAAELLRIVAGAGVYFLAAYTLKSPRQVSFAVAGLLLAGITVTFNDLPLVSKKAGPGAIGLNFSVLGTHEHSASLLALLFPLALGFAWHPRIEEKRRLTAVAATLVLGVGLLLSRGRSAWCGALLALILMLILLIRHIGLQDRQRESHADRNRPAWQRWLAVPAVQLVGAIGIFIALTGMAPMLSQRGSLVAALQDDALAGRLVHWQGAGLMIAEEPITGWGLGAFTILQGQFSHWGDDPLFVLGQGTSHVNNAHNYYLQWAAETGSIGLILHLIPPLVFLMMGIAAFSRLKTPFQQALLMGSLGTVVAGMVDSIASPMYYFPGIWVLLYAGMGLGIAALRPLPGRVPLSASATTPTPVVTPALPAQSWVPLLAALGCSLVLVGGVWGWGVSLRATGQGKPSGELQVIAVSEGPLYPGQSAVWKAVFLDERQTVQPTMPGTLWLLDTDNEIVRRAEQELSELFRGQTSRNDRVPPGAVRESYFRVLVPGGTPPGTRITVSARYRDRYGRLYTAASVRTVAAARP